MDEKQLLSKLDHIKEIPTLPTIVFELDKYFRDPESSIRTVCKPSKKIRLLP